MLGVVHALLFVWRCACAPLPPGWGAGNGLATGKWATESSLFVQLQRSAFGARAGHSLALVRDGDARMLLACAAPLWSSVEDDARIEGKQQGQRRLRDLAAPPGDAAAATAAVATPQEAAL